MPDDCARNCERGEDFKSHRISQHFYHTSNIMYDSLYGTDLNWGDQTFHFESKHLRNINHKAHFMYVTYLCCQQL
jgi:hypothetical protein